MSNKIKMFQVDAFTNQLFSGNPAAVCLLEDWLADELMQKIGAENNLAETAFLVKKENGFEIRWFTPGVEVDLCGHATLASAYVIFEYTDFKEDEITFISSKSGILKVKKENELLTLNFPADKFVKIEPMKELIVALQVNIKEFYKGKTDYLVVLSSQEEIENLSPDFRRLAEIKARGIIVTARGNDVDFVSRFFAPYAGIDEDPVTGSAHTTLTPYWAEKLNKTKLKAQQLSKRGGVLMCEIKGERVLISGNAKIYLEGEIFIN